MVNSTRGGLAEMPYYRLYCLDGMGKIERAEWLDANDDEQAVAAVRAKKLPVRCEIWNGKRLVAEIEATSD